MKEPQENNMEGLKGIGRYLKKYPARPLLFPLARATGPDQRALRQRLRPGPDYDNVENRNGKSMGIASAETWQCGPIHCEPRQRRGRILILAAWILPRLR
eukprot:1326051-Pyramimonas_sp.AAC.1